MAEMLFSSISFLLEILQYLIANEKKSRYNRARDKDLVVVSILDYCCYISKLIEIQDVMRH